MPMGFGAERANLMGEAAVHMPSAAESTNATSESSGAEEGDTNLNARANNAKTQLI